MRKFTERRNKSLEAKNRGKKMVGDEEAEVR